MIKSIQTKLAFIILLSINTASEAISPWPVAITTSTLLYYAVQELIVSQIDPQLSNTKLALLGVCPLANFGLTTLFQGYALKQYSGNFENNEEKESKLVSVSKRENFIFFLEHTALTVHAFYQLCNFGSNANKKTKIFLGLSMALFAFCSEKNLHYHYLINKYQDEGKNED